MLVHQIIWEGLRPSGIMLTHSNYIQWLKAALALAVVARALQAMGRQLHGASAQAAAHLPWNCMSRVIDKTAS